MSAQDETSPLADGSGPPQSGDQDTENIEADALEILENDSAFGDDLSAASSRTSLTSGITKYREENGRRYHAYRDGKYLMPNDDAEQDRLDLHHHIFNLVTGGKLFHAPIQHPSRVLDAGTGTGIWAIDFADLYPGAHVIGCDLSPIQPGWIPPNLEFEVDDIEDTWRHKPFSYIHIRGLSGAIKDWKLLLTQAYDHLDPGGYLEIIDFETWIYEQDGDGSRIPMIQKWQEGLNEAGEKFGRSFNTAARLKNWIEEVGFVNVEEIITKVPATPWPKSRRQKEIGLYQQQNMLDASSSYGQAHFTRILGWTLEDYAELTAAVRCEFRDPSRHLYSNLYSVYGHKPGSKKRYHIQHEEDDFGE